MISFRGKNLVLSKNWNIVAIIWIGYNFQIQKRTVSPLNSFLPWILATLQLPKNNSFCGNYLQKYGTSSEDIFCRDFFQKGFLQRDFLQRDSLRRYFFKDIFFENVVISFLKRLFPNQKVTSIFYLQTWNFVIHLTLASETKRPGFKVENCTITSKVLISLVDGFSKNWMINFRRIFEASKD